jgi:hypothetical protein
VTEPRDTPWGTRDIEVITPERVRVVYTGARELERDSQEVRNLAASGIDIPETAFGDDNDERG